MTSHVISVSFYSHISEQQNLKIMKKLLIAAFALMIVTGASATVKPHFSNGAFQRGFGGGGLKGGRTTVVVGGYAPYYAPYYSPYVGLGLGLGFGYPWYGYPYYDYGYGYNPRPSRLDREIMAIQHDYDQKIRSAREDDSMTGRERRATIRDLKQERDQAISNARKNYYKQGTTYYNNNSNKPTYYNGYDGTPSDN